MWLLRVEAEGDVEVKNNLATPVITEEAASR